MAGPTPDLLQGTLDLLVLQTLIGGPMHGWGIAQRILDRSRSVLEVNQGSLYPALHRLEDRGWVAAEWGTSENNRRARFYRLTPAGKRRLALERAAWERYAEAVRDILKSPFVLPA
ncbi:MAG: PadR family transcriptional regulator [Gemmatimonadales bacterium]|nr:PadR family transcriptional regulator [Gemmatimonadales bacterium]